MTIDARERLRSVRYGKELAFEIAPKITLETSRDTPLVMHASSSSLLGEVSTGARRWVMDSGSCVAIVGEGSVTENEKKIVEDMEMPMRLSTASGEVTASKM